MSPAARAGAIWRVSGCASRAAFVCQAAVADQVAAMFAGGSTGCAAVLLVHVFANAIAFCVIARFSARWPYSPGRVNSAGATKLLSARRCWLLLPAEPDATLTKKTCDINSPAAQTGNGCGYGTCGRWGGAPRKLSGTSVRAAMCRFMAWTMAEPFEAWQHKEQQLVIASGAV